DSFALKKAVEQPAGRSAGEEDRVDRGAEAGEHARDVDPAATRIDAVARRADLLRGDHALGLHRSVDRRVERERRDRRARPMPKRTFVRHRTRADSASATASAPGPMMICTPPAAATQPRAGS